ncbi:MAG: hypothetical protein QJR14_00675 [Bacillota bacterium]|nr:hypothetical protein [Bacillota bacterium]
MRVLLVAYEMPPALTAESILAGKTVRSLLSAAGSGDGDGGGGGERLALTCVTALPDPLHRLDPDLEAWLRGAEVRRHGNWPRALRGRARSAWRRLAVRVWGEDFLPWTVRAGRREPRAGDAFDLLWSRSEPGASHTAARAIRRRARRLGMGRLPWVAQFSDPWALNPYRPYVPPGWRRREEAVLAEADALVFPSEALRDLYDRAYPALGVAARSTVLPHGFDPSLYPPRRRPEPGASSGPLRLVHVGDFYGLRSPRPLLEAARALRPRLPGGLELRLVGRVARSFPAGDAAHIGPVGYLESLREMVEADLLVVVEAPLERAPFLPSKLIDYLGARRPVVGLTVPGSPAALLLARLGFPWADVRDPAAVEATLADAVARLGDLTLHARTLRLEEFTMERAASTLLALFHRLAGSRRP